MTQRVSPQTALIASRIIIALASLVGVTSLLLLTFSVQDQREFNHCVTQLDSQWRRAVGYGLAAVAENDDEALLEQTRIIRELSQEEC